MLSCGQTDKQTN